MRSRQLHRALRELAQEASIVLAGAVAHGAEVGFEIVPEGGRGSRPPLYCYRPLTAEFVLSQRSLLDRQESYLPALQALSALDGLNGYLDAQRAPQREGTPRELAEAVLCHFLARVFEGTEPHFGLSPERFEPAYRELERLAVDGRTETVLLTMMRGVTTEAGEVPLGNGLVLAPPDCLEDLPPDASWLRGSSSPSLVVALAPGDGADALERGFARLRDLQTAMRLFAPGIAFEPLAWVRGDGTPWRALPLGLGGRSDGTIVISEEQEDELRAFCSLIVRRRPASGEVAWALQRFEYGCERADALVAMTDHLLALRALLEPEGPRSGRLAGRVGALCAEERDRESLTERMARAISLEQSVIAGLASETPDALKLAAEVESHLRAVMRDIICGHLEPPFSVLADEIIERRTHTFAAPVRAHVEDDDAFTLPLAEPLVPQPEPEPAYVDDRQDTEETVAVAGDYYEDLEVWGEPAPLQPELFPR